MIISYVCILCIVLLLLLISFLLAVGPPPASASASAAAGQQEKYIYSIRCSRARTSGRVNDTPMVGCCCAVARAVSGVTVQVTGVVVVYSAATLPDRLALLISIDHHGPNKVLRNCRGQRRLD